MKAMLGNIIVQIFSIIFKYYRPILRKENLSIKTDAKFITPATRTAMVLGLQERAEKLMVKKYLRPNLPVLEFGSSLGSVTLEIISKIGADTPILSVEANPILAEWLSLQVASSGRKNHRVLNAAIVGSDADQILFKIDSGSLGSRIAERESDDVVLVKAIKISDIVTISQFKSFAIVCDIEGSEFSAFECAQDEIKGCELLIIELHPPIGSLVDNFIHNLKSHGLNLKERRRDVFVFTRSDA